MRRMVEVPEDLYEQLRRAAVTEDRSIASVVRRALAEYLKEG